MRVKLCGSLLLLGVTAACSADSYVRDADEEVGDILLQKQYDQFRHAEPFSIEMDEDRLRNVMIRELNALHEQERERIRAALGVPGEGSQGGKGGIPDPRDAELGIDTGAALAAAQDESTGPLPGTGTQETEGAETGEPGTEGQETQDTEAQDPTASESGDDPDGASQDDPQDDPTTIEEGVEPPPDDFQGLQRSLEDIERRYAELLVPPSPTSPSPLELRTFSLLEVLEIAAANSRDYQRQKESLYLSALDLSLDRFRFETQYGVSSSYRWSSSDGGPGSPRSRTGSLDTSFSITRLLASGGFLVFDFTNSIVRRFTGFTFGNGDRRDIGSVGSVSFTQPLLQGFGPLIVQEPLTQAERDVVYALRAFERFRRSFAVDIANEYYGLLQSQEQIKNAYRNYLQVIHSREQAQAFAEVGRRSQIDTDRARQSELNSRDSWIRAVLNYEDALDRFKITLGLPIEANIAPDPRELRVLEEDGIPPEEAYPDEVLGIACGLQGRLDYLTEVDRLWDTRRRVVVTSDQLRTVLDLNGSYTVGTDRETAFDLLPGEATWSAGIDLDLPIQRVAERNSFRRAIIAFEQQKRARSLASDQVKQDVRRGLRRMAQLRQTFKITDDSVRVAERRVEATNLQVRQGKADVFEALDATDALVRSKNQLTGTLIDVRIELLTLFLNMGLLRLTEEGIQFAAPEIGAPPSEDDR